MSRVQSELLVNLCLTTWQCVYSCSVSSVLVHISIVPSVYRTEASKFVRRFDCVYLLCIGRNAIRCVWVKYKICRTCNAIIHSLIRACLTCCVTFRAISCRSIQQCYISWWTCDAYTFQQLNQAMKEDQPENIILFFHKVIIFISLTKSISILLT